MMSDVYFREDKHLQKNPHIHQHEIKASYLENGHQLF